MYVFFLEIIFVRSDVDRPDLHATKALRENHFGHKQLGTQLLSDISKKIDLDLLYSISKMSFFHFWKIVHGIAILIVTRDRPDLHFTWLQLPYFFFFN